MTSYSLRRRLARAGLVSLAILIAATGAVPALAQSQPATDQTQTSTPSSTDKMPAPKSTTVQGVTVTADAPPVRADIDRRSYDISKDLAVQNGASVADALRNVPSVDVDVDGKVTLRGQAGVTIMVDGKPAPLYAGPGGAQALLQVPAGQYDRVEVMTNPSAAFSPDGAAGVINLVSKKNHPQGSFGSVRASAEDADRYRGGASASIKKDPLTVVLYVGGARDQRTQEGAGVTQAFDPTGALLTANTSRNDGRLATHYIYADGTVSWQLDPKTQLSFNFDGYHHQGTPGSTSRSVLTDATGAVIDDVAQKETDAFGGEALNGELKFRHDFDGDDHNFTADLTYSRWDFFTDRFFTEAFAVPPSPDSFQRSDNNDITHTLEFSGDYVRPLPSGAKLKAGWDINREDDLNTTDGFIDASSPGAAHDPGPSVDVHFRRVVSAGYLTWQQPFGKLTVMGGLRVEGENLNIDDVTTNTVARADDVHLYPTLHLDYAVDDNQHLQASYSERIQRPNDTAFDPFVRVYGPFSENAGNPDLKPQQTQDFETSWQNRVGGAFVLATAYYKLNTGGVTQVTSDVGNGVLLPTQENLTRSKDAGLELVVNGKLPHGFGYSFSSNAYWNEIDGSALGDTVTRSQTTVTGRASINWQADPKDFLQVSANSGSRTLTPQGFNQTQPTVNLGWRRKLTDKLTFVTTVQDLFDNAGSKNVYDSPLLRGHSLFEQHDRQIFFGLTLTFGAAPRQQQQDFDYGGGPQH